MPKWTLTKWIICLNCVIAAWSLYMGPESAANWIKTYLPLTVQGLQSGEWWRVLTCSWVHDDLVGYHSLHLMFNMMTLAALGQVVETSLGRKHFLLIYIPAGIAAVAFYMAEMIFRIKWLGQNDYLTSSMAGASGCIMGLVAAFAMMHPRRKIMVFPWPFPVKALTAILCFCGASVIMMFIPETNIIAHSAHLGGAAWGFLYMGLTGWNQKRKIVIPDSVFGNSEDLATESLMLQGLSEEQIRDELPYLIGKIQLRGTNQLTRRERAFLLKAREMSLI